MWDKDLSMEEIEHYFKNVTREQFLKDLEKANCLHLIEDEKDFKKMSKAFIGETMKDFFCNGFFGSRTFDMRGAEITKVYDSDDENAIVIEVRKSNGRYDYGYFENGWRDWQMVYEYLAEWITRDSGE